MLTRGVRAAGMKALDGWDGLYSMGSKRWDFLKGEDRRDALALVDWLDPVIVHAAAPCSKLSQQSLHPGQRGYDAAAVEGAETLAGFAVELVRRRTSPGGGGSVENPKGSRFWKLPAVVDYFGSADSPAAGRYFAAPDLCGSSSWGSPRKPKTPERCRQPRRRHPRRRRPRCRKGLSCRR